MIQDPIRMVIIDLISAILLTIGIFFYLKIYPKKRVNYFILLLLITALPLISILRNGTYESGDLTYHAKFAMQFFANIKEGNLLPAWIEKQCSGYGCPDFIFTFLLSQYLISILHFFGITFISSTKIVMILTYYLSGIGMYIWMKDEYGKKSGFIAAIFYLFAPYHLIDLHFRVSIAELLAMAIIPFIFLTTKKFLENKNFSNFIYTSILFAALIISHQVASLATLAIFLIYGIYIWLNGVDKNLKTLILMFFSYIYSLLFTAFYWIPLILEKKYTLYGISSEISFHPLIEFFYSPNKFGFLFQGHHGEIYTIVGYTQWIIIFLGIITLLKKQLEKKDKIMLSGALLIFIFLFIMMLSITKPAWETIPILKNFQFSWRLSIQTMITISVISAILIKYLRNNIFFVLLCFLTILYTILNWGNRGMLPQVNDSVLSKQMVFPDHPGQVDVLTPVWVDSNKSWIGKIPEKHIDILNGNAKIVEIHRSITSHEYVVSVSKKTTFKENTYYFPGWKLFVNNQEKPINYKNKKYPGVITFRLNPGLYKIELKFTDTLDRKFAKLISLLSIFAIIIYLLFRTLIPKRYI